MADHDEDSVNLALLAHDLRTPLGVMRLTGELIGQGPLNDAQQEQLSILIRSIDSLEQMTSELVAAAHPTVQIEEIHTSIAAIVSDSADLFRIAAKAKGLKYAVSIESGAQDAVTKHSSSLRRIVVSLLDNAIKYTPAGEISVAATVGSAIDPHENPDPETATSWICISVQDTGPGIDAEERARLFQPFVRGRHGRETGPGSGLGLWGIAQKIRQLNGRLVMSQPVSGGSRFDVWIPVEQAGNADADEQPDDPVFNPLGSVAGARRDLPAHVLIVDDNDTNCRLLAALLESFGISSDTANSGEQAIGLALKAPYDAALLDLHMPGMSGVETAENLRSTHSETELPLIAVTAALESVTDARLVEAGFQKVLTKPLSPVVLYEAMQQAHVLKRHQPG